MHLKRTISRSLSTVALIALLLSTVMANEVTGDASKFKSTGNYLLTKQKTSSYIIQLKGNTAIAQAALLGELLPTNQLVAKTGNRYNAKTPAMIAYTRSMERKQKDVAGSIGSIHILHSFKHTYNGFSAKLSAKQKALLESHPDVVGIWEDKLEKVNTANTPTFTGLTGPGGQHTLGIKGEDIVIGVIDTGVWPENPSFADDGTYSDPTNFGWQGACDTGTDEAFTCNNKLIGARFFDSSFKASFDIQYSLGEFDSPRDADGHGSHTASTAGGNEGVAATLNGIAAGTISGMAPRARIAMYKACWNSDYINADGGDESGCFYGDTMAAIDAAVIDGVDVINYSIAGSRTDLTVPSTAAMLNATAAGVFVAVSAGNNGPDIETVGTPAPWVTSVAASTYDGTSTIVGKELHITSGPLMATTMLSIPAAFSPDANGLPGELALADPLEACDEDPLTNDAELAGKIVVIARGTCPFTEKFINVQNAGALGVLIYTYDGTTPFEMGGSDPLVAIPGSMLSYANGRDLADNIEETSVIFSDIDISGQATEVGNMMALFSSRGPNLNTYDIIKPDITAPGVKILAATTPAPMFSTQGESFRYLQGTSMSSPHIAGMAALFKESNSDWTPAQIKSALMTTARQNLTKEDGTTPADPYDFGAGHVDPVSAMDPGLLFDINIGDYLAFLCGQDEDSFVEANGISCGNLEALGYSEDASQLNLASIAISELFESETIFRTVSNATDMASDYTANIEAPDGFTLSLTTYDATGVETEGSTLTIDANGMASFSLTFSPTDNVEFYTWKFGAITWTDSAGHFVRLPIAIKAIPAIKIDVPESISGELRRGRFSYPVQMLYSGKTSIDYTGLVAPFGIAGSVEQDPDSSFSFNEPGLGTHFFHIPEGTKVARFSLIDALVGDGTGVADLDMYVYRCDEWICTQVGYSFNFSSNEDVILVNPPGRSNIEVGDVYLVWVHGYNTGGVSPLDYTMLGWVADEADSSTRVRASTRAMNGRYNYTSIMTRGLAPATIYMGGVTYYNDEGEAEGTTVLELESP